MTSGVTVETVGNDSWRVARQAVTIRREESPLFATRYGSGVLDMSENTLTVLL